MPPDEIDRPALTKMAERPISEDLPASRSHLRCDDVNQPGMMSIEKAIQLGTAPAQRDLQRCSQRCCDAARARQVHVLDQARLEVGDELLAYARVGGDVPLPQGMPASQRAEHDSDPAIVHGQPSCRSRLTAHDPVS